MMDNLILIRTGIVLAALCMGTLAVIAGRRRVRWLETQRWRSAVTDPVMNLCVRGMAGVILLALLAWLAVGDRPVGETTCQGVKEAGRHELCAWTH